MTLILETYEDRESAWVGLRLLVLSLAEHAPDVKLRVWGLPEDESITVWLRARSNVVLEPSMPSSHAGWDVKASILLAALNRGAEQALWIDTDIIVTQDPAKLLPERKDLFVATEEFLLAEIPQGSRARLAALDLPQGRELPRTVNSCFMRVTERHRGLLEAWKDSMGDARYRLAQSRPYADRPLGLGGAQDVLTALLGSARFEDTEVHLLREGVDVAHCMHSLGYRTGARLRALWNGLPPLVHALGSKPWEADVSLTTELSPYTAVAAKYAPSLPEADRWWLWPRSRGARVLNWVFRGHPSLRALPLTALRELQAISQESR